MQKIKSRFSFGFKKTNQTKPSGILNSVQLVFCSIAKLFDWQSMRTAVNNEVQSHASEVESQYVKFHANLVIMCESFIVSR